MGLVNTLNYLLTDRLELMSLRELINKFLMEFYGSLRLFGDGGVRGTVNVSFGIFAKTVIIIEEVECVSIYIYFEVLMFRLKFNTSGNLLMFSF